MEGDIGTASMLLIIGMVTVFTVLLLVVLLGNILIRTINYFQKDILESEVNTPQVVSHTKMAVLVATVESITQGKGKITAIEKINDTSNFLQ